MPEKSFWNCQTSFLPSVSIVTNSLFYGSAYLPTGMPYLVWSIQHIVISTEHRTPSVRLLRLRLHWDIGLRFSPIWYVSMLPCLRVAVLALDITRGLDTDLHVVRESFINNIYMSKPARSSSCSGSNTTCESTSTRFSWLHTYTMDAFGLTLLVLMSLPCVNKHAIWLLDAFNLAVASYFYCLVSRDSISFQLSR
jgi:hypothetical protein